MTRPSLARLVPIFVIALAGLLLADSVRADGPILGQAQQKPKVKWVSYAQALAVGFEEQRGVFIYFLAKGQKRDHEILTQRPMAILSTEYPCVKVPHHPEDGLREEFKITDLNTVVITDWFGNEVRRLVLKDLAQPFPLGPVQGTLEKMPALMRGMQRRLSRKVKQGEKEREMGNFQGAMKILLEVTIYEGYPAIGKAQKELEKVFRAGEDIILEAFKAGETTPEESIARLRQVMVDFKGTRVEAGAKDAIEKIRIITKKRGK